MRLPDDAYFEDRPVRHCAQGDLYSDVPCTYAEAGPQRSMFRGARKRAHAVAGQEQPPEYSTTTYPQRSLVVVCNYTCGFVAQPPGTDGYSHSFRQVAPVVPLMSLIDNAQGIKLTEARRLKEAGYLAGMLYVPRPAAVPATSLTHSDIGPDDYVVCLYRMTTVTQDLLDSRDRVARMSQDAQRRIISAICAVMGPDLFDPTDLRAPDMSSSWPDA
jgi:hypothetical protein